jgi:hypothetical protein
MTPRPKRQAQRSLLVHSLPDVCQEDLTKDLTRLLTRLEAAAQTAGTIEARTAE